MTHHGLVSKSYCYAALNSLNPVLVISYDRSHVVLYSSIYALLVSKGKSVLTCPVEHLACVANNCGGFQPEGIELTSAQSGLNVLGGGQADQGVVCEQEIPLEHAAPQSQGPSSAGRRVANKCLCYCSPVCKLPDKVLLALGQSLHRDQG